MCAYNHGRREADWKLTDMVSGAGSDECELTNQRRLCIREGAL